MLARTVSLYIKWPQVTIILISTFRIIDFQSLQLLTCQYSLLPSADSTLTHFLIGSKFFSAVANGWLFFGKVKNHTE